MEIRPAPKPHEREAIEVALRKLIRGSELPAAYASPWRQAGLAEAVSYAADAGPRSSFGATRA